MTYSLNLESKGNVSDCVCDYKTRAEMTYQLEDMSRAMCQIGLPLLDEGRDDVHPGRGEGRRCVKSQLRLQNKARDDVHPGGGEGRQIGRAHV